MQCDSRPIDGLRRYEVLMGVVRTGNACQSDLKPPGHNQWRGRIVILSGLTRAVALPSGVGHVSFWVSGDLDLVGI